MSKKEILNKDIDFITKIFHTLFVSFLGICAYAFINYESLSVMMFLVLLGGGALVLLLGYFVLKQYLKARKELEQL